MKALFVAALVLVPGWVLADSATNAPAPSFVTPAQNSLQGLTPEQQKQAEPILASEAKQRKAIEDNKALSTTQKQVQIAMVHKQALQQIQALKAATPPAKP
jgi:hypothetical protein